VDGEQERLVVPEETARATAAPDLESTHEVDCADPVRPTIDQVAQKPESCVLEARP